MKKNTAKYILSAAASLLLTLSLVFTGEPVNAYAGTLSYVKASRTVSLGSYSAVTGQTPEELVRALVGDDANLLSASALKAGEEYIGYATGCEDLFGFERGVVLGSAPVTFGDSDPAKNKTNEDADLAATLYAETEGQFSIGGDLSSLQFEMIASGKLLNFRYAFASSEFDQNEQYNDIFGLYVSVNDGPFENIALLPEGDKDVQGKAVTITNLRQRGGNDVVSGILNTGNEFEYFYGVSAGPVNGVSKIFTAMKEVEVGDKVKIKFVIADVSDTGYGSYVVIEAGSLSFQAPKAGVDTKKEMLKNLDKGEYSINDGENTYRFDVTGGSIPIVGKDSDGKSYDFIEKQLEYTYKVGGEVSEPALFDVPPRAEVPDALYESDIAATASGITVTGAVIGEQYIVLRKGDSPDKIDWDKVAVTYKGSAKPVFTNDANGKPITTGIYNVYSRVAASSEFFRSDVSEPSDDIICCQHEWSFTGDDDYVEAECTADTDPACLYHSETIIAELEIVPTSGGYDVRISDDAWDAAGLPAFEIKYATKNDPDNRTNKKPTEAGDYIVFATVTTKDGTFTLSAEYSINEDGEIEEGVSALDGLVSYINRNGGFIIYDPRPDVIKYATDGEGNEVKTSYINMTKEQVVTDMIVACYTFNGTTWNVGTLEDLNKGLSKAFSNQTKLKIADKYDSIKRKAASDANVLSFGTVKRRDSTTRFTPDYYLCRDDAGITNGQWCLTTKNRGVNFNTYEIGICDDGKGKEIGAKGYGVWPAEGVWPTCGGVWVSDIPSNGKTLKEVYLYRETATESTPASKPIKITVTSVVAAPKVKVDYSKLSVKLKEGMSIYFGEEMPVVKNDTINVKKLSPDANKYKDYAGHAMYNLTKNESKKAIDISGYITETRNTIKVWQSATIKKPASAVQTILLAAAQPLPNVDDIVTIKNGKAKLAKNWQIKKDSKWGSTVPLITSSKTYELRFKGDAKGGAENDTTFALTEGFQITFEYGVYDESKKSNNKGIIGATIQKIGK